MSSLPFPCLPISPCLPTTRAAVHSLATAAATRNAAWPSPSAVTASLSSARRGGGGGGGAAASSISACRGRSCVPVDEMEGAEGVEGVMEEEVEKSEVG
ncbi:hypothetical protein AB1Y20_017172 [Prymnesium parvum]|uniref:Uncharacterized protein n=1 Tax=Prymnesium parvum TaxID=97485 RepID=A0AB34IBR4_PRYPA